jgi:hypothetical protein
MTIIAVAANPHFAVQVSDRRLTRQAGHTYKPVTDEENKALYWVFPDAHFVVGYTGIARVGREPMDEVLAVILVNLGIAAGYGATNAIAAIPAELDRVFRTKMPRSVSASMRRLTVMITGFQPGNDRWNPTHCLVSNFQRWGSRDADDAAEHFALQTIAADPSEGWPTLLQHVGARHAVRQHETDDLRTLLAEGKPPRAVRDKMVDLLYAWSSRSHGTIGLQANSVVIEAGIGQPDWRYHSEHNSHTIHGGMTVMCTPETAYAARFQVSADDPTSTPPMVVPMPHSRRSPCPCGSSRQYRLCHGRDQPR